MPGEAEGPNDDPHAVPADTVVYRRISPDWWVDDGSGGRRISSQAFQDHPAYMSVAIGLALTELEQPTDVVLDGFDGYGLARLEVSFLRRDLHLGVTREPTEVEPWHGGVWGRKSSGIRNKLANAAVVEVVPAQ